VEARIDESDASIVRLALGGGEEMSFRIDASGRRDVCVIALSMWAAALSVKRRLLKGR
jgi:hypothetical protein